MGFPQGFVAVNFSVSQIAPLNRSNLQISHSLIHLFTHSFALAAYFREIPKMKLCRKMRSVLSSAIAANSANSASL
jgi:hypothetical protein